MRHVCDAGEFAVLGYLCLVGAGSAIAVIGGFWLLHEWAGLEWRGEATVAVGAIIGVLIVILVLLDWNR